MNRQVMRLGMVLAIVSSGSAQGDTPIGETISWNNPAGGLWAEPTNWSPAQVPTDADTVVFAIAGCYSVDASGVVTRFSSLSFKRGTVTLDLDGGALLNDPMGALVACPTVEIFDAAETPKGEEPVVILEDGVFVSPASQIAKSCPQLSLVVGREENDPATDPSRLVLDSSFALDFPGGFDVVSGVLRIEGAIEALGEARIRSAGTLEAAAMVDLQIADLINNGTVRVEQDFEVHDPSGIFGSGTLDLTWGGSVHSYSVYGQTLLLGTSGHFLTEGFSGGVIWAPARSDAELQTGFAGISQTDIFVDGSDLPSRGGLGVFRIGAGTDFIGLNGVNILPVDLPIAPSGTARQVCFIDVFEYPEDSIVNTVLWDWEEPGERAVVRYAGSFPYFEVWALSVPDQWSPADLDFNGVLNFIDLGLFLEGFNAHSPWANLDNDLDWDFFDLASFLAEFNLE